MWKPKHLPLFQTPSHFLYVALLIVQQINAISGAKTPLVDRSGEIRGNTKSGEEKEFLLQRQSDSLGFHQNRPNSLPSYYPSQNGNYDAVRGNSYISNGLRNDYREKDRDYYPSSSAYASRSSGGIGGGSYYNYREKDDYRERDYRGRDRQPYYDDYRYNNNNNNYYQYQNARDREMAAAQSLEFNMRNGQQRHQEYQKRIGQGGQEYYDPFYFIGVRNKNLNPDGTGGNLPPLMGSGLQGSSIGGSGSSSFIPPPSSPSSTNGAGLLAPSTTSSGSSTPVNANPNGPNSGQHQPSSSAPANHPLRNRRNSHQRQNEVFNDIGGDKYELMSAKSGYPPLQRQNSNHHQHHHRFGSHHLDQQFLTREQLVRRPDFRVPYPPSNHIDRHGPTITSASGQPWSVRIGTQLKVNDDGRSPNSHRFYVRDEVNSPGRSRSRNPGPLYRRR